MFRQGVRSAQYDWLPAWVGVPPDIHSRYYLVNSILLHWTVIYHEGAENQAEAEQPHMALCAICLLCQPLGKYFGLFGEFFRALVHLGSIRRHPLHGG